MDLETEVVGRVSKKAARAFGPTSFDADDVQDAVDQAESTILNYCNISEVPSPLKFVWSSMALDILRWQYGLNASSPSATGTGSEKPVLPTVITGITEGDASVSLAVDTESQRVKDSRAHNLSSTIDGMVLDYVNQLNRFRRMSW